MNANLRGNVTVRGVAIDEYIKRIVLECNSATRNSIHDPPADNKLQEVEGMIEERMQPLCAFKDEQSILSDNLRQLSEKVMALESKLSEKPDGSSDFRTEIEALHTSIEKFDKRLTEMKPRRGVDQNTLDSALAQMQERMDRKIDTVSNALATLQKELEE